MKNSEFKDCDMYAQYNSLFEKCTKSDNWTMLEHKKEKIENLDCESVHFFNKILGFGPRNITFFIVNGVIIGVGYEYAEGFSLFGEDY